LSGGIHTSNNPRIRKLKNGNTGEIRLLIVFFGIVLFIVGFLVTVTTLSDGAGASGNHSHGLSELVTISGSAISLCGIVVATLGPLSSATSGRKQP
jgi:uncharacterized membrane protein